MITDYSIDLNAIFAAQIIGKRVTAHSEEHGAVSGKIISVWRSGASVSVDNFGTPIFIPMGCWTMSLETGCTPGHLWILPVRMVVRIYS